MELWIEKETAGQYGIIDTFIDETVILNTKTTYTQDITAVFKGFTNDFSVGGTPNNIKMLGYFGYTEQLQPANIQKKAKLYLNGSLYKQGLIKIQNTSWVNGKPSLFSLEFSDGQRNLTEILGEDMLSDLGGDNGNVIWSARNIQNGLQSIQTGTGNVRWFIPLVSTERIFIIDSRAEALQTDNIAYSAGKPIASENVLLPQEIRPAMFISDILTAINAKYQGTNPNFNILPTPYIGNISQLTDLATMCVSANVAVKEAKAKIDFNSWTFDTFREERFNIIPKPDIDAFELNYLGYGGGGAHDANFDMVIRLCKTASSYRNLIGLDVFTFGEDVNINFIYSMEVWEVNVLGEKIRKLSYAIQSGAESNSTSLSIRIGLDVFTPEGGSEPSTLVKPLIALFVSAGALSEWRFTNIFFNWNREYWNKAILNNVQPQTYPNTVNLFESLPKMKLIDFVKSIYTMFGYKKFGDKVLNDFYYTKKDTGAGLHKGLRVENDLTAYADLSKMTKKPNTKYDGYNLKHATSEYQQNVAFLANPANLGQEYGQLKYPFVIAGQTTPKPKTEFKIETKFTAPVFNPIATDADTQVFTFYPFGSEPKLNDLETRFIFDTIVKELPIFYYNGVADISTPYAFVDTTLKQLKAIGKYHKISHRSNRIKTGTDNYISSLFNVLVGIDYVDQNTLYAQDFKTFIEDTLSGKKLIHTIDLLLPSIEIQKFSDDQEIIIKETKYIVMESDITLTNGKTKLTLLNK